MVYRSLESGRFLSAGILCVFAFLFLGACAASPPAHQRARESSIPWNRPASWEGGGALGGAMPTGMNQ